MRCLSPVLFSGCKRVVRFTSACPHWIHLLWIETPANPSEACLHSIGLLARFALGGVLGAWTSRICLFFCCLRVFSSCKASERIFSWHSVKERCTLSSQDKTSPSARSSFLRLLRRQWDATKWPRWKTAPTCAPCRLRGPCKHLCWKKLHVPSLLLPRSVWQPINHPQWRDVIGGMVVLHRVCHSSYHTIYYYYHSEIDTGMSNLQSGNLLPGGDLWLCEVVTMDPYTPHVFATNNKTDRIEQASRTSDCRRPSFCCWKNSLASFDTKWKKGVEANFGLTTQTFSLASNLKRFSDVLRIWQWDRQIKLVDMLAYGLKLWIFFFSWNWKTRSTSSSWNALMWETMLLCWLVGSCKNIPIPQSPFGMLSCEKPLQSGSKVLLWWLVAHPRGQQKKQPRSKAWHEKGAHSPCARHGFTTKTICQVAR